MTDDEIWNAMEKAKTTEDYRKLYNHYTNHNIMIKYRIILEKAFEIINTTTNYNITLFKGKNELFDSSKIYSFHYKNLKNYLTQN